MVAVKILKEECRRTRSLSAASKTSPGDFSLDHPNIVKVYDVTVTDTLQYIVMEYVDGITLKEYMEHRGQP